MGSAPRSLSLGSKREAAEHADRDKRMEQETRQHHLGTLARLRGRLLPPAASPTLPQLRLPRPWGKPLPAVEGPRVPAVRPGRGGGWRRR